MKVQGRRTNVEYLEVEVDLRELLTSIYKRSLPSGLSHIGEDGCWYKVDGHDYHKNEKLYARAREATPDELELEKAYYVLMKFVRAKGL